jgi:ATP-dependent exoDNAse (exonuclease V) beta subunit
MLRERISRISDFPTRFANGAVIVHAEMPLFWRMNERGCVEGIVDLALFQPAEKNWFILDWKTNRIERHEVDKLRASYRPQVAAYWKAVAEMTRQPVSAAIYSTATGQFIAYDPDELAREWERLRNLTQDELAGQIKKINFLGLRG